MNPLKVIIGMTWLLGSLGFFIGTDTTLALIGRATVCFMAVVHTIEFLFYIPFLKKVEGSLSGHFFQVFWFGYVYYMEIKKTIPEDGSASNTNS